MTLAFLKSRASSSIYAKFQEIEIISIIILYPFSHLVLYFYHFLVSLIALSITILGGYVFFIFISLLLDIFTVSLFLVLLMQLGRTSYK